MRQRDVLALVTLRDSFCSFGEHGKRDEPAQLCSPYLIPVVQCFTQLPALGVPFLTAICCRDHAHCTTCPVISIDSAIYSEPASVLFYFLEGFSTLS